MDYISLDVKENWALKLGNLRKLKKNLEKYTDEILKLSFSKFNNIDLSNIARKSSIEEIMKLLEFVMFCILNCPNKGAFIRKIMELDESAQIQLMYFIQKVMGEEDQGSKKESQQQQKELETLKTDKKRITDQLTILEQELALAHEEYAKLHSDFQQIRLENERMANELEKKSCQDTVEADSVLNDLKSKLTEKDNIVSELQKSLDKNKKHYEKKQSPLPLPRQNTPPTYIRQASPQLYKNFLYNRQYTENDIKPARAYTPQHIPRNYSPDTQDRNIFKNREPRPKQPPHLKPYRHRSPNLIFH